MTPRAIVQALGGRWHGSYGVAHCPAHDDREPSLSVAAGRNGKLVVRCFAGCSQAAVVAALRARGLWPERDRSEPRRPVPRSPAPAPRWPTVKTASGKLQALDLTRPSLDLGLADDQQPTPWHRAAEIWLAASPLSDPGTEPARLYLRGRGLPPPWPATLAFARLRHPETREANVPALIVARHEPTCGQVRGIQRIFLTEDGAKYPKGTCKMSLASIPGGRCELIHAYPLSELVLAEGVETGLSAWRLFDRPAWAICGGFPPTLHLRPAHAATLRQIVLCADNDPSGGSVTKARTLAAWLRSRGLRASVVMPEAPGADANDVLLTRAG